MYMGVAQSPSWIIIMINVIKMPISFSLILYFQTNLQVWCMMFVFGWNRGSTEGSI